MANPNWPRWIRSSVGKYLKAQIASLASDNSIDLPSLLEGIEERQPSFMESPDRVEIRVNGPFFRELSKGYYRVTVDVNCLVTNHLGGVKKNAYLLDTVLGGIAEAMESIPIFRLGTGVEDDQSQLGCLSPRPGKSDAIRVMHFGEIDSTKRITQGVVDARYQVDITE